VNDFFTLFCGHVHCISCDRRLCGGEFSCRIVKDVVKQNVKFVGLGSICSNKIGQCSGSDFQKNGLRISQENGITSVGVTRIRILESVCLFVRFSQVKVEFENVVISGLERFGVSVGESEFSVFDLPEWGIGVKVAVVVDGTDGSGDNFDACLKHLPLEFAVVVCLLDVDLDGNGEGLGDVGVFDPESEPDNVGYGDVVDIELGTDDSSWLKGDSVAQVNFALH
jgi:hypothetical protein